MRLLVRERRRWGGFYGDTHTGCRWLLFGCLTVWRRRRRVRR